jgi:hypothetical protein
MIYFSRTFLTASANALFARFSFFAGDFVIASKADELFGFRMPARQSPRTIFTAGTDFLGTDIAGKLFKAS